METDAPTTAAGHAFDLPRLCRYFSERSPQPMVAAEGAGHVVRYLNPAFARLAGKAAADLIGRPFAEAVPAGNVAACLALLDRVFHTGTPETLEEQEHGWTPPAYWSYAVWAILGADERPVGVMIQVADATETAVFRRQATAVNEALVLSAVRQHELIDTIQQGEQERRALEVQMFQTQKLESLGVLAGGIAHDLNNILTPVIGFAELAREALPPESPVAPMLDEVVKNAGRAADLVQQILAYAGKGRFVIEPIDLSALVRAMGGLLDAAVASRAGLTYDLPEGLPPVEADATQLRQVVMNLVTNAAEAVDQAGGTVTVRTSLIRTDNGILRFAPLRRARAGGPFVCLEVSDTGCGMTAAVLEKIFEPFFTTKFTGRGLGLAAVHGIVRGHGGSLDVRSEPGRGSTFRLLLPASTLPVVAPPVAPQADEWQGIGTILVIDDEEAIRNFTSVIFGKAGFTVLAAAGGSDGVAVFREHQQEIAAVLLDLTMPGMGGLAVADALREIRADLPVVLMSGYHISELTLRSEGHAITEFLQKPFTPTDLLTAVRRALGR